MTSRAIHVLLEGLIDYAGLFPPAKLPPDQALRNYERYRNGDHSWALGRFIAPAALTADIPANVPLSVLADPEILPPGFDVLEVKAVCENSLARIADQADGRTVYVELTDLSLLPDVAKLGLRAKIRTGGVTADAFPSAQAIAQFMRACRDAGVTFKATAGLHHPVRCIKPLTYAPDAPTGTMHGFLNLFLAAALLEDAEAILLEDDPHVFTFDDDGAAWRDRRVDLATLAEIRRTFATSFGSCSFEEPIDDLRQLGWLS